MYNINLIIVLFNVATVRDNSQEIHLLTFSTSGKSTGFTLFTLKSNIYATFRFINKTNL